VRVWTGRLSSDPPAGILEELRNHGFGLVAPLCRVRSFEQWWILHNVQLAMVVTMAKKTIKATVINLDMLTPSRG
jgi:hypothetical protein